MNDHAQRVRAQLQRALQLKEIEYLVEQASPFFYLLYVILFAAVLAIAVDGWQRYKTLAADHRALVDCINGRAIGLGDGPDDAILRCSINDDRIIPGIRQFAQGEQP